MNKYHTPVLLDEVLNFLKVKKGGLYIDATLGGGGHTEVILKRGGKVLGIDLDWDAIAYVKKQQEIKIKNQQLILAKGNFRDIEEIAHLNNFKKVSGIIFDLGISSHQIDSAERGFSFLKEGPLDMRMDKDSGVTAETLVNILTKGELYDLFNKLGQEHRAFAVSNNIVRARRVKAIRTTAELAKIIEQAYGIRGDASDFTKNVVNKRVFQALRMAVNAELENLKEALPKAIYLLDKGARIAVISFHSLEDRIVKNAFRDFEKQNMGKVITKKPIMVQKEESVKNKRSQSAKLRIFERN